MNLLVVPKNGSPFRPDYQDVTFASETKGTATVEEHTGVITAVATGDTTVTATIERDGKTSLVATCAVNVTA